jgi:hypothetical protein
VRLQELQIREGAGEAAVKCKECGYHFVLGDERTSEKIAALKAVCVLLYSLGKGAYNMLGQLLGRDRSLICRWIREAGMNTKEPEVGEEIRPIEFDEMGHFIESKKETLAHQSLGPSQSAISGPGSRGS